MTAFSLKSESFEDDGANAEAPLPIFGHSIPNSGHRIPASCLFGKSFISAASAHPLLNSPRDLQMNYPKAEVGTPVKAEVTVKARLGFAIALGALIGVA